MVNRREKVTLDIRLISNVYLHERAYWERKVFECRQTQGMLFFLNGSLQYDFNGFSIKVKAGDIVLLPMCMPYSGKALNDECLRVIVVDFETADAADFQHFPLAMVTHTALSKHYQQAFERMLAIWNTQLIDTDLQIKSILYSVFADLLREKNSINDKRIQQIIGFIDENLNRADFHLSDICEQFYISESQLRRDIRRATGTSPNEYIKNKRMNLAHSLLMYGSVSVGEAARLCGFSNPYYFSRCFHETFGMPPSEYARRQ